MGSLPDRDRFAIREAGLVLRPWRLQDAEPVYRACQDPDIQRWTSLPGPYRRWHAEGFVGHSAGQWWDDAAAAQLGVFEPDTGGLLGGCGLGGLDLAGESASIGYWTAPWARGRNVAERAARAVARWALTDLGIRRLAWRAEVGNHASRLVAIRIGVALEGILRSCARRDGRRADEWIGSLLPGQLREADAAIDPVIRLRAVAFGHPQPRLSTVTRAGTPVTLRAPVPADLDAIVAACRDPDSVRWTSVPDPYDLAAAESFVGQYAPGRWAGGDGAVFAIADEHGYAGSIELRIHSSGAAQTATAHVADIGFLVAPWARGCGYASGALRRLCRWGFEHLALRRIEWRANEGNEASRWAARKAGFRMEGLVRAGVRQRGECRDAWTGGLLATDLDPDTGPARPDTGPGREPARDLPDRDLPDRELGRHRSGPTGTGTA